MSTVYKYKTPINLSTVRQVLIDRGFEERLIIKGYFINNIFLFWMKFPV
jgi:hypothetical protein